MMALFRGSSQTVTCAGSTAYSSARAKKASVLEEERQLNTELFVYAYENNPETGSGSWNAAFKHASAASENFDTLSCDSNKVVTSLAVSSFAFGKRNGFVSCRMRRVVFAQRPDVRLITSFFLDKEFVFSSFLQERGLNLSIDSHRRGLSLPDFNSFVDKFQMNWQLKLVHCTFHSTQDAGASVLLLALYLT